MALHSAPSPCAGLSVLQCAALSLSAAVQELEGRASLGQARLHTLRKEQMMETLERLLQMDARPPAPVRTPQNPSEPLRTRQNPSEPARTRPPVPLTNSSPAGLS